MYVDWFPTAPIGNRQCGAHSSPPPELQRQNDQLGMLAASLLKLVAGTRTTTSLSAFGADRGVQAGSAHGRLEPLATAGPAHLILQLGLRFSAKASGPSFTSSDCQTAAQNISEYFHEYSIGRFRPTRTICLMY